MKAEKDTKRLRREGSFTLIETVIALSIVAFLIVEVAAVQGNSIVFSEYGANVTKANWLAKRVMSQVEYFWQSKDFKDLITEVKEKKFEDQPDFSYSLEIKEWKFPFLQLLSGAMGGGSGSSGSSSGSSSSMSGMLDTVIKQVFGEEPIFMTAHVEVSWPEGAQKNQTALTLLLTNQAKLDQSIIQLKPVYDKLIKPAGPQPPAARPPGTGSGSGPAPPGGGTNGGGATGDTTGNQPPLPEN